MKNKTLYIGAINRLLQLAGHDLGDGKLSAAEHSACKIVLEIARENIFDVNEPVDDNTEYDANGELPDSDGTLGDAIGKTFRSLSHPDIELECVDGYGAGCCWWIFEIKNGVHAGKTICIKENGTDPMKYRACQEWDDGAVSNTNKDQIELPYREGEAPDGTGTGMGGYIIPELDGLTIPAEFPDILTDEDVMDKRFAHHVVMDSIVQSERPKYKSHDYLLPDSCKSMR